MDKNPEEMIKELAETQKKFAWAITRLQFLVIAVQLITGIAMRDNAMTIVRGTIIGFSLCGALWVWLDKRHTLTVNHITPKCPLYCQQKDTEA